MKTSTVCRSGLKSPQKEVRGEADKIFLCSLLKTARRFCPSNLPPLFCFAFFLCFAAGAEKKTAAPKTRPKQIEPAPQPPSPLRSNKPTGNPAAQAKTSKQTAAKPPAGGPDSASRDYLIEQLENLYKSLPEDHFSKKPVALRLAHILSLRAEEQLIQKAEKGGGQQIPSAQNTRDTQRALSLYKEIAPYIKNRRPSLYSRSLFEMAWLHRLSGEREQAIALLEEAVSLGASADLALRAWFNLGEMRFELYQYEPALAAFEEVLKKGDTPWAFRTSYRRIWCLYNLSRYEESLAALESFLKSPLYLRGARSREEKKIKSHLQDELTSLYSRGEITDGRIQFLYSLQKDSKKKNSVLARRQRLADLAESLSLIGRAKPSNKVWRLYLEKQPAPAEQMKAYISMLKNDFILGETALPLQAEEKIRRLFALQRQLRPCPDEDICAEAKKLQTAYIKKREGERAREEAKTESGARSLFSLYQEYNSLYPGEFDMLIGAAFAAKDLKEFSAARDLFQKAALAPLPPGQTDEKKKAELKSEREKAALFQMEMAELSKDSAERREAYNFYIQHGSNKGILFKTKYQLAWLLYEEKNYGEAAKRFAALALAAEDQLSPEIRAIRRKAARFSLAGLSAQKEGAEQKDRLIAESAGRFQKMFPENKEEFARIRHTAILNIAQNLTAGKKLSPYPSKASKDKNILRAYQTLSLIDTSLATKEELKKYYYDRLLLAKDLLYLEEAEQIIPLLLSMPSLSAEERQETLRSQLWLAEARFDFKEILRLVQDLNPEDKSEEHLLRLAQLADLAGADFISLYKNFLAQHPQSEKRLSVARLMIERAPEKSRKIAFLNQYGSYFSKQPETLSYWALKLDESRLDQKFISRFVEPWPFMKSTFAARFLQRQRFIESFLSILNKARAFSLPPTASEKRIAANLKAYSRLIEQLEAVAAKAVEMEDWLSQVIAFSGVQKETARFYESVLALPAPKDLTPEEKAEYQSLIRERMAPYKKRADQLLAESEKLWSKKFLGDYKIAYAEKDPVYHGALKKELDQLSAISPEKGRELSALLAAKQAEKPAEKKPADYLEGEIKQAQAKLTASPFNTSYMEVLLHLEERRQNKPMSYYLRSRIRQIDQIRRGAL